MNVTRTQVIAAVRAELGDRPTQIFGDHLEIGQHVADRLCLEHELCRECDGRGYAIRGNACHVTCKDCGGTGREGDDS